MVFMYDIKIMGVIIYKAPLKHVYHLIVNHFFKEENKNWLAMGVEHKFSM